MDIKWGAVFGGILAAWLFIRKWVARLDKIAEPLVQEAEKRAQDGLIDRQDRKMLVMRAIALLEEQGTLKLGFLSRMVISAIVDRIAGKLPDFKISVGAKNVLDMAKKVL